MATQVQFRGGTTTEHSSFNGAAREVTVDTTKQTLVVQDGSTNGGFPLLREKNPDNQKVFFGTDNDLEVFHTGTDATIDNNTGDLYILTTGSGDDIIIEAMDDVLIKCQGGEDGIKVIGDGAVELYHNGGTAKLATSATGVTVTGVINGTGNLLLNTANSQKIYLGTSNELQMYYDGTNSWFIDSSSGGTINTSAKFVFQAQDDAAPMAILHQDGSCRFWHNDSERLQTTASGIQVGTGTQNHTGTFSQTAWQLDVNNSAGDCYALFAGISGAAIELKDTGTGETLVLAANGQASLYSYANTKPMVFHTTDSGGTHDRLHIMSGGEIGMGVTAPNAYYSTDLVIGAGNSGGITIANTTGGDSVTNYLMFADGTGGGARYSGYIGYTHQDDTMYFRANNGTVGFDLNSSGNILVNNGNIKFNSANSGQGIDFSVSQVWTSVGNTDSELFDHYEEGTFTPRIGGTTSYTTNYSTGGGSFTRIGRLVHCTVRINNTTLTSATGTVLVFNLPFAPASVGSPVTAYPTTRDFGTHRVAFNTDYQYYWNVTTSYGGSLLGAYAISDGNWASWPVSDWDYAGFYMDLSFTYYTAT